VAHSGSLNLPRLKFLGIMCNPPESVALTPEFPAVRAGRGTKAIGPRQKKSRRRGKCSAGPCTSTKAKLAANPVAELGEQINCLTQVRVQGLCGGSFTLLQFCTTPSRCSFALQCKCVRTFTPQFLAKKVQNCRCGAVGA